MTLRDACQRFYWAVRRRVTPHLMHSQDAYAEVLRRQVNPGVAWLDVGCGHQILPDWHAEDERHLTSRCRMVVGVDADFQSLAQHQTVALRVMANISRLPFPDESFDLITANMVVEHLEEPIGQFREISRLLRPGGVCVLLTPNAYGYPTILARCIPDGIKRRLVRLLDQRKPEDVFRTYYRANTASTLRRVADSSALEAREIALVTTDAVCAVLPPLAALELIWIRLLMWEPLRLLRPNIVATLRKARPRAAEPEHGELEHASGNHF